MPAVTTPFTAKGDIDENAFGDNLTRLLDAGATGAVVGGCTGEFWALSHDERKRLATLAKQVVNGRGTVIMGVGCISVEETALLARHAEKAGCDGALVVPPYFVKLTDDEIVQHYTEVNAQVGLPICLYNIPANAVNAVTPALASRLASLDKVVAIKESSGDWGNFYGTLLAVKDELRVFCGPASVFGVPALQAGADGLIDCFPNFWTAEGIAMYDATQNGENERAQAMQETGRGLTDLFVSCGGSLYPATKAAMDMIGVPGGGAPRRPLRELDAATHTMLERGLRTFGIIS
jgi:4-hydroxy-tetrahydrodipicolinate synthase